MAHSYLAAGRSVVCGLVVGVVLVFTGDLQGQAGDNPYRPIPAWGELPEGREWGATSAVYSAPDGNIWVAERCGGNSCLGSDLDPVLLFNPEGDLLTSFGAGMIAWPHGLFVEPDGSVWVADASRPGAEEEGLGHAVYKFSPSGELLLTLGTPGVPGNGPSHFDQPSDMLVAPDGAIFVADGHGAGGNNRVVKFSPEGRFVLEWGSTGYGPGQFRDPHALAMDSEGRLFVGDRSNARIQIFDQNGNLINEPPFVAEGWTQFGRPSGIFIDQNDMIYVADSESAAHRNPGYERGIRIGDARSGWVTAFILDPEPNPTSTSAAEGVAVDLQGNIYGAEVGPQQVVKWVPYRTVRAVESRLSEDPSGN